jgi:competence protein ComEC
MTRACLSLLAGMYALQLSSFAATSNYLGAASIVAFSFFLFRQFLIGIGVCLGAFLFYLAAQELIAARIPEDIAGDSIVIEVEIDGFPSRNGSTVSFVANPMTDERLPERIRLSWFEPPVNLHAGDSWRIEVRLRRPRGNRNPGSFDYESWLFRERIGAVGYVVSGRRNHLLKANSGGVRQRIRRRFISRVESLLDDPEPASVLIALVVGARHLISRDQWDRYAITGTSHLMAISGLHIGLAAGMAYFAALFVAGMMRSRRNIYGIAILTSIAAAICYALLSGFAIPARRATLVLVLAGVALMRKRRPNLLTLLSATCIVIVVTDPLSTLAPGFVLSFAAVVILIWIGHRDSSLVTLQSMLLCGLLPLTAILFDRISLAALPVNLLALPLVSFVVVPLSLLGLLLDGPLQALGDPLLQLAAGCIVLLEMGLRFASSIEWSSASIATLFGTAWLYVFLPTMWVLLPPGWPGRHVAWIGIVAAIAYKPQLPRSGCAVVEVLDVGQGLAVAVRTRGHFMLYDSGPSFRSGGSAAHSVILPYLRSRGIGAIDQMIISHSDLDHAGGVAVIAAAMPVQRILSGEPLTQVTSTPCHAGQSWTYDGIEFRILHPNFDPLLDGNDSSCVLLLEAGGFRMLFSGDIEKMAEHSLIQQQVLPSVDVVLVPHHGSRTSSTTAFVRALMPSIAIVSAAHGNQWGFPKQDIVQRWEAVGARVLNTATAGAIELRFCAVSGLQSIRRYRADNRRIWHE